MFTENSYFYLQPNKYIFPGAEVVEEMEDEDDRSSSVADLSEVDSDEATEPWANQPWSTTTALGLSTCVKVC